jgi:hypothetical protein
VEIRSLGPADVPALREFLLRDVWNNVYLLGILHWYGVAGPRARFTGAFADGRLVGVLAEGREVHCWYASLAPAEHAVVAALAACLAAPRVAVLLGRADTVTSALTALPAARVGRTSSMVLGVSDAGDTETPGHPVRRATVADLPRLVALYEGYEFDGYPTPRHVRRALAERLRRSAIYVIEQGGRIVAARRIDASSPEVVLFGGLTVHPAHRGRRLGRDVRLGASADVTRRGLRHCALRHVGNPRVVRHEHREHAAWLVANLVLPPPPPWRDFVRRLRARLSRWDRPCRRRPPDFDGRGGAPGT